MSAALEHLASLEAPGRHAAVLGEMAELGPDGPGYHREVGALARRLGVGPILGVGELAREYAPDAWAPDAQAAVPTCEAMIEPGDAVLVKGSRSVGLELVSDELRAHRGAEER
jgi:UDP-N-acetylmuramyl pentapeptide synthase